MVGPDISCASSDGQDVQKRELFPRNSPKNGSVRARFAVKILFDELAPGIDPLCPTNKLIVALGPIAGIPHANTGKASWRQVALTASTAIGIVYRRVVKPAQGRVRRPDRGRQGRRPDHALYRGRQGRILSPTKSGPGPMSATIGSMEIRQRRRRPQHRPGRRKHGPLRRQSAVWKDGPAGVPASARSWGPSS